MISKKIYCVYPVILQYNDSRSDGMIDVIIPDFGIHTEGRHELDVLEVAKREITKGLEEYKGTGKHFPFPTSLEDIELRDNERTTLVEIDLE